MSFKSGLVRILLEKVQDLESERRINQKAAEDAHQLNIERYIRIEAERRKKHKLNMDEAIIELKNYEDLITRAEAMMIDTSDDQRNLELLRERCKDKSEGIAEATKYFQRNLAKQVKYAEQKKAQRELEEQYVLTQQAKDEQYRLTLLKLLTTNTKSSSQ